MEGRSPVRKPCYASLHMRLQQHSQPPPALHCMHDLVVLRPPLSPPPHPADASSRGGQGGRAHGAAAGGGRRRGGGAAHQPPRAQHRHAGAAGRAVLAGCASLACRPAAWAFVALQLSSSQERRCARCTRELPAGLCELILLCARRWWVMPAACQLVAAVTRSSDCKSLLYGRHRWQAQAAVRQAGS